jgi:hypothetical protein
MGMMVSDQLSVIKSVDWFILTISLLKKEITSIALRSYENRYAAITNKMSAKLDILASHLRQTKPAPTLTILYRKGRPSSELPATAPQLSPLPCVSIDVVGRR